MRVTLTQVPLDGSSFEPFQAAARSTAGYIRVGREPGGKLGEWHRTAMLFLTEDASEVSRQLHQIRVDSWTVDGILLTGTVRTWRRKDCDESPQAWLLSFQHGQHVAVYPLRAAGLRRPREEVRTSTPLSGLVCVDAGGRRPGGLARRATLLTAGQAIAWLDRVQLQRWDSRGLVLAGIESTGHGRRLDEAWQSWYVTFPGVFPVHPLHGHQSARKNAPSGLSVDRLATA